MCAQWAKRVCGIYCLDAYFSAITTLRTYGILTYIGSFDLQLAIIIILLTIIKSPIIFKLVLVLKKGVKE